MSPEPISVLLIEDNPGDARLIREMLAEAGGGQYVLHTVNRLSASLPHLAEGGVDAVLLDLSLPDAQGRETLVKFQAQADGVPVVVLTGREDEALGMELVQAGAQDYLVKGHVTGPLLLRAIRYGLERQRLGSAVREGEGRYRLLFDNNPHPMWVYDVGTLAFLAVNDAAVAHYGYSRDEFLAMTLCEIRPAEDVPALLDNVSKVSGGIDRAGLWRHVKKDGTLIDVEITSHTLTFLGRPAEVVLANDITERRRAEAALRESEERFRAVTQSANEAVVVADDHGRIVLWNKGAERMFLFPEAEVIGQPVSVLIAESQLGSHREAVVRRHAMADAGPLRKTYESQARRKDGHEFPVEISLAMWEAAAGKFFSAIIRDISERRLAEEQIQRQVDRMRSLRTIDAAITASFDLRLTLSILLDQVTAQLGVDAAAILLLNRNFGTLNYAAGRGFLTAEIEGVSLRMGEGLAGRAALERRVIGTPNIAESGVDLLRREVQSKEGFAAYYGVPLISKGQIKGVLDVFHRSPLTADSEWLDFLETLAGQAAIAVDNATLFDGLQQSNTELRLAYDATIEGWSRALDLRDKETEGHTRRVTEMTLRLAERLGLDDGDLVHIRRGALLHDIGKMAIPDSILLKPGPLTEEEWTVMRLHPAHALDMLSPIPYLRPALDIPYCHHEKWDGTGYPRGLAGSGIPLAARIFAVADVWDALSSDRPYRDAWPRAKVLDYMRGQAGSHFDPDVMEAFLRMQSE